MKLSPQTQDLVDSILELNPSHSPFLKESIEGLDKDSWDELDNYLAYCGGRGIEMRYIAECYNTIVQDTFIEQIYFMRHKHYRHSTYAEVADTVYQDPEYMEKYMYGLAVTLFFWPAHRKLKEFFEETLPKDKLGHYLEIGPGHGFYFMMAIADTSYTDFLGVDISPKSIEMTQNILESGHFGVYSNYTLVCKDFLAAEQDGQIFDALVMGEVLEHVEDPGAFLRRIRELTRPDSYIYISTCMNAPAVDHLALFTSAPHLESIINAEGLRVVSRCLVPYQGLTIEETEEKQLPMNIGAVLTHA